MKRIVFYDDAAIAPYSEASLGVGPNGIGGAEASVARVAVKLSEAHRIIVAQHGRQEAEGCERLQWIPLKGARDELERADAIVVLRRPRHMITVRRFNQHAPTVMWYHDWNDAVRSVKPLKLRVQAQLRADAHVALHTLSRVTALGVSRVHSENIRTHLSEARATGALASRVRVDFVYNPIPDELTKADVAYDTTKLVFVSAAWKGLDMVLSAFQAVRRAMPDMKLFVASPGYAEGLVPRPGHARDGVTYLGSLSHASVIEELRTALCVFYPANVVPETFGCVFAESHAVGTPVLAHPFGAACELLTDDELLDARNIERVVACVRAWRDGGRPVVSGNPGMRLSSVAGAWEQLLFAEPKAVRESQTLAPGGVVTT